MVLYSAAGHEVHAAGTVSGAGHGRALRARLQQRQGGRWVTRATGELKAHGQLSGYSLGWSGSAIGRREQMRVEVVSGRRVLGVSAPHDVAAKSPVSVQSTLRNSTVQPTASQVLSVSGEPSGTMVVVLARGAKVPAVGGALVIDPSAKAPRGVLGLVTATTGAADGGTRVTTKPATLEDAYSSFEAHINGTLGELSEHAHETPELAHAAGVVNLDPFSDASFDCDNPSVKDSITHKINLSDLQVNAEVDIPSWSNGFYGPGVLFSIGGQPKLGIGVKFTGDETCTAKTLADIPIPAAPGLELEIGPDFTLHASGSVGVELEWTPRIFYGFSRFRGEPDNNWESFHNGGTTNFSGDASLTLGLALEAGLSLGGRVGIRGSLGPQIKGDVSAQSSPPQACLNVNADFAAALTAFANDFFNEYTFTIGSATFGNLQLYHACTSTGGGGLNGGSGGSGSSSGSGGSSSSSPPVSSPPPSPTPGPLTWSTPTRISDTSNVGGFVACPLSTFCMIRWAAPPLMSTDPGGGAVTWLPAGLEEDISGVSCPSTSFCVAASGEDILTSTDPTGGAGAWTSARVDPGVPRSLTGLSCPSASFCVAVDDYGDVLTSTDPAGGAGAWTITEIVGGHGWLTGVSCASESLCVATYGNGNVVTSTNPTGGAAAWTTANVAGGLYLWGVSCEPDGLCVVVPGNGEIYASVNPAGGASAWHGALVDEHAGLESASCATTGLCVAVDSRGDAITSTDPTGGKGAWTEPVDIDEGKQLAGVSCASSELCVAVDFDGDVIVGEGS